MPNNSKELKVKYPKMSYVIPISEMGVGKGFVAPIFDEKVMPMGDIIKSTKKQLKTQ